MLITSAGSGRGGSIQCRPKLATLSPGPASPSFPFPVPVRLCQPDVQGSSYRSVRLVFVERDRRAFSKSLTRASIEQNHRLPISVETRHVLKAVYRVRMLKDRAGP